MMNCTPPLNVVFLFSFFCVISLWFGIGRELQRSIVYPSKAFNIRSAKNGRFILLIVCVSLTLSISPFSWGQSDSNKLGLTGPVMEIETTEVLFTPSSWGWTERNRYPSSRIAFNELGNKTEELIYTGHMPSSRIIYTYSTENRLNGIQTCNLVTSALTSQTFDCDESGRLKEEITRNRDGSLLFKTVYSYGKSTQPAECMTYNSGGQFLGKKHFTYADNGQISNEITYLADGTLHCERRYVYGPHGKPVETCAFNGQNVVTEKCYYHYDNSGAVFEAHCYNAYAKLNEKRMYVYVHDSEGNWTRKYTFVERVKNGRVYYDLNKLECRKITYTESVKVDTQLPATAIGPAPLLQYINSNGRTIFNAVQTSR